MSNTLHLFVQIRTEPTREPYNWRQKESRQDMGLGSLNRRSTYCLRANRTPQLGRVMKTFYNTSISSQDHKEISTATHSSNRRDSIWNYNERESVCVCVYYLCKAAIGPILAMKEILFGFEWFWVFFSERMIWLCVDWISAFVLLLCSLSDLFMSQCWISEHRLNVNGRS